MLTARGYQIRQQRRSCKAGVGDACCAACARGATCNGDGTVTVHLAQGDWAPGLNTPDCAPTSSPPTAFESCSSCGQTHAPDKSCVTAASGVSGPYQPPPPPMPVYLTPASQVRNAWAVYAQAVAQYNAGQYVTAVASYNQATSFAHDAWVLLGSPLPAPTSPTAPSGDPAQRQAYYLHIEVANYINAVQHKLPVIGNRVGHGDLPALQGLLAGLSGSQTGDAASAFIASVAAGTVYKAEGDAGSPGQYDAAVDAYKAAGQAAVSATGIGGVLAAADPTGTATTYTQQAWAINAQLNSAAINSTNSTGTAATQSDAQQAQGFVTQMSNFYVKGVQAAIAANQSTPQPSPSPSPSPAPTPSPAPGPSPAPIAPAPSPPAAASSDYAKPVLIGAGLVGAAIIGTAVYRRYFAKGGGTSLSRMWTRRPSGRGMHSARTQRA